jgi:hypothetical protein
MSTPNALHSKKTPKWGTPEDIATRGRLSMGGVIHLDPGSSELFNTAIGAEHIYTEETDGIKSPWDAWGREINVFLNPPGGLVEAFWQKLIEEWASGVVSKAIWIGFSVEQLATLQDSDLYPLDFSTMIARKRIPFWYEKLGCLWCGLEVPEAKSKDEDLDACPGRDVHEWVSMGLVKGKGPSHSNYVTGIGIDREIFSTVFGDLGRIVHGSQATP